MANSATSEGPRVSYIWSKQLQQVADQLPSNLGRSSVVHDLIHSFGLLGDDPHSSSGDAPDGSNAPERQATVSKRARVVAPLSTFGTREQLLRYHDQTYVDHILNESNALTRHEDDNDDGTESSAESDGSSLGSGRPAKRRKRNTEYGLEHDCPRFPALPQYARLVAAATLTACQEIIDGQADIAINWDGGRHHAMRNRASGFCYVADVVLGIMHLTKFGKPREVSIKPRASAADNATADDTHGRSAGGNDAAVACAPDGPQDGPVSSSDGNSARMFEKRGGPWASPAMTPNPAKPRKPRIMYIDLDIHEGDGVSQAFLSPSRYPSDPEARQPRPPQVLTLSVHHHSRTFFPPHRPFSGLAAPTTPNPFTLSIPLHAYPSCRTYEAIWASVESVRDGFDPDYVVLQLGVDGLPGDRVGQYGAWSTHGPGGVGWWTQRVKDWGLRTVVLGGGGYDNGNAARAWATATSVLADRPLDGHTDIPHHAHFPLYSPSFTLEVPSSHVVDENTVEHLDMIKTNFGLISERISHIMASSK